MPAACTAVICTKLSDEPSSGWMKPLALVGVEELYGSGLAHAMFLSKNNQVTHRTVRQGSASNRPMKGSRRLVLRRGRWVIIRSGPMASGGAQNFEVRRKFRRQRHSV